MPEREAFVRAIMLGKVLQGMSQLNKEAGAAQLQRHNGLNYLNRPRKSTVRWANPDVFRFSNHQT
jgi:hypothetical protein